MLSFLYIFNSLRKIRSLLIIVSTLRLLDLSGLIIFLKSKRLKDTGRELIGDELWRLYSDIIEQRSLLNNMVVDHNSEMQDLLASIKEELDLYISENISKSTRPGRITIKINKARGILEKLEDPATISKFIEELLSIENSLKSSQNDIKNQKLTGVINIKPGEVLESRLKKFEVTLTEYEDNETDVFNPEGASQLISFFAQLNKEFGNLSESGDFEELSVYLISIRNRVDRIIKKKLLHTANEEEKIQTTKTKKNNS